MKQAEILALLREASQPDCGWDRRNKIQVALTAATAAMGPDGVYEIDGPEAGIHLLVNDVFYHTAKHRPDMLPALFPLFAHACGDRDGRHMVADIDWSLV